MGAQVDDRRRTGSRCAARTRRAAAPIDAGLQPHSRRGDDARRCWRCSPTARARCATSRAGASRRPTASPRWRPSCASSARTVEEGADFLRVTPPARAARRRSDRHLRRPPHGDVLLAASALGAACRCASTTRLRRQDLPGLLRGAVRQLVERRMTATRPGHRRSTARPLRARARSPARSRSALGFHYLDSGALYRLVALAALRAGVDADDEPRAGRARRAPGRALRRRRASCSTSEDVTDAHPRRGGRRSRPREVARAAGGAQRAARAASGRSGSRPGLVADGRDMGTVVFPDAELKVFLTASAESVPSGAISS